MAHKKGQGSVKNGRDSRSKRPGVKKFDRRNAKILANRQKLRHRGQRFAGRNIVDIPAAVPQIVTHFVLRNTLLQPQLRDAFTNKFYIHTDNSFPV